MQDMRSVEKAKTKEFGLVFEKSHKLIAILRNIRHRIWYLTTPSRNTKTSYHHPWLWVHRRRHTLKCFRRQCCLWKQDFVSLGKLTSSLPSSARSHVFYVLLHNHRVKSEEEYLQYVTLSNLELLIAYSLSILLLHCFFLFLWFYFYWSM